MRIILFAGSYDQAKIYADKMQIAKPYWMYISHDFFQGLEGIRNCVVMKCGSWKQRRDRRRMLDELKARECLIINLPDRW